MSERRIPMIERIVYRVEEHIEEWRERDAVRHTEAEANRDRLWAAAAERERHPSTRGSYAREMGIKGSWLVFEPSE